MKGKHPRLVAAFGVATIGLALGAPGTAIAHGSKAVPIKQATFNAYATGTYLHTHLLQSADSRLVNVNVAGSAAAVDHPKGLSQRADEMGRYVVNPEAPGKISWGRGVAVEAGLAENVPSAEASLLSLAGVAKQSAPPTVGASDFTDLLHLDLDPLLYNSTAAGEARANWDIDNPCLYKAPEPPTRDPLGPPPENLTADFGYGQAYVEDLELLDLAEADEGQPSLEQPLLATNVTTGQGIKKRATGWTASQTYLAGQYAEDGKLLGPHHGLASDVRATLLPVTLFTGGPEGETETTIEVLGPWRLVGAAGGVPGSAWVHFGPEREPEPNTPILRISHRRIEGGVLVEENTDVLTVEMLTGQQEPPEGLEGLVIEGGRITIPGIAEIVLGEAPRAIGDESETSQPTEAADGTKVSAAVDVLRIEVLEAAQQPGSELAEIRLGHMEVEAEVPAGGLSCEEPPPPDFPRTGGDEAADFEVTDLLPAIEPPAGQEAVQEIGQETGQESLKAESVRRQVSPTARAVGLFSAVVAILMTSGAMLFRRWSRS